MAADVSGDRVWRAATRYVARVDAPLSTTRNAMLVARASADLYAAALAYEGYPPEHLIHGDVPIYNDDTLNRVRRELSQLGDREVPFRVALGLVDVQATWSHVLAIPVGPEERPALVWGGCAGFAYWGELLLGSMAFLHDLLV